MSAEAQQRLRGLVKQLGLASRLTVHPEAASTAAGMVTVNTAGRSRCDAQQQLLPDVVELAARCRNIRSVCAIACAGL